MLLRTIGRIFKEDIVSSLTGGFYIDSAQSHFVNLVHIYTWIIFFVSPLITYLVSSGLVGALVYSLFTTCLVSFIKLLIWKLHRLLDTKEPIALASTPALESFSAKSTPNPESRRPTFPSTSDSLSDHDREAFDQELEDRCRRVGQAGLDMADLADALHRNQSIVPRHLPSSTNPRSTRAQEFDQQASGVMTTLKWTNPLPATVGEIQAIPSGLSANTDMSVLPPTHEPVAHLPPNKEDTTEGSPVFTNTTMPFHIEKNNSASNLTPQLIHKRYELLSRTNTLHVPPSGHRAARLPVQRQFSLTSALPYSDVKRRYLMLDPPMTSYRESMDPTERMLDKQRVSSSRYKPLHTSAAGDIIAIRQVPYREPSHLHRSMTAQVDLVRADMEQCRRAIIQMKADLEHLPLGLNQPVAHTGRDLELFDRHPLKRVRAFNAAEPRSSSQRHRRAFLSTNLSALRLPSSVVTHFPQTPLHRRLTPTIDMADFDLSDAISFWRQQFNSDVISRGIRSHSLRQPVRWNLGSASVCEGAGHELVARRAHSLRQTQNIGAHLYPIGSRPPLRRPGSALRLQRQESTDNGCASTQTDPDCHIRTDTQSSFSVDAVQAPSQLHLKASSTNNDAYLAQAETLDDELPVPSTSRAPTQVAVRNRLSSAKPDSSQCQNPSSVRPVTNFDLNDVDENGRTLYGSTLQDQSIPPTKTRAGLIRRPGIRRKGTSSPAQSHTASIPTFQMESQPKPSESEPNLPVDSPSSSVMCRSAQVDSNLDVPTASTSVPVPEASTDQTVDELLAQLMGVRSLAEAGLTREQCLAQLRGSDNAEDSENAELDILFAVAAATDKPRDSPKPQTEERSESLCTLALLFDADRIQHHSVVHRPLSRTSSPNRSTPVRRESTDSIQPWRPPHRKITRPPSVPNAKVYELQVFPRLPFAITLRVGRLQLDALFDRWLTWWEAFLSILMSLLVSVMGYLLLCSSPFSTASVVMFCFAIAGCHYSLVKSVQPDAASPQHGFNRIIVYSRAAFFCLMAAIFVSTTGFVMAPAPYPAIVPAFRKEQPSSLRLASFQTGELSLVGNALFSSSSPLLLPWVSLTNRPLDSTHPVPHLFPQGDRYEQSTDDSKPTVTSIELFGSPWSTARLAGFVRSLISTLLLIYPVLFPLGLIPQLNTALTYLLEQIDIHVFGGSGSVGLFSACFSLLRNAVALAIGWWPCLSAMKTEDPCHLWFSVFWGIYLPLCFLQSRLPSNLRLYAALSPCSDFNWRWQTPTWDWIIRLSRFSCLDKLRSKADNVGAKRRYSWFKGDKGRRKPEPRVLWWRSWLPFISDMGKKSSSQIKSSESDMADRLLRSPSARRRHLENISALRLQRRINSQSTRAANRRGLIVPGRRFGSSPSFPVGELFLDPPQLPNLRNYSLDEEYLRDDCNTSADQPVEVNDQKFRDTNFLQDRTTDCFGQREQVQETGADAELKEPHTPTSAPPLTRFHSKSSLRPAGDSRKTTASVDFAMCTQSRQRTLRTKRSTLTGSDSSGELKRDSIRAKRFKDPLPQLLREALLARLQNDFICCVLWVVAVFGIHASPLVEYATNHVLVTQIIVLVTIVNGTFLHYIWPNLRKPYPWLCFTKPQIAPHSRGELLKFEIAYFWLCWTERNVLMPMITVLTVTQSILVMTSKFGHIWTCIIVLVTSMKMLRNGFNASGGRTFLFLLFTELLFTFDFHTHSELFPLNYFFVSIFLNKFIELVHKLHFVYIYTAPFRFTWGSCAHALIQIASVPHTLFLLGNCLLSTILSSPLEPVLASAVFITSYARPIKFWEVTHRTERMETTNTALISQLRGISENQVTGNLNAIFYEHLTRNLQSVLAGDIQLGRVGGMAVNTGDFFIFSSEEINLVIHIIEVGNGLLTFQLRGLEFSGTSCHERETEALRCTSHNTNGCCCFNPGHHPGMLSVNAELRMRWTTWQFIYGSYNVSGYRMTTHGADTIVRLTDFRKVLVNRFVQCIIFYVLQLHDLPQRLENLTAYLRAGSFDSPGHFDLDPVFLRTIDGDYDEQCNGVTRRRFIKAYGEWIRFCLWKKAELVESISCDEDSPLVSLCYALSILGRRCMGGIQSAHYDVNQVLRGIHDIFKGDIRVMTKDDWILTDLDLLQSVVTPAMRIALKLYQDEFLWTPECTNNTLYRKIVYTEKKFVICHETDPMWRFAVLNDAYSLFSLRWVGADSDDMYRFVQLTKSKLQFRAVKINPECVRGLWAGQQREQIYLRNTNVERGSIQMAQHVLRNLVNSSCDPPIGYPIYVSPILTSFAGTNRQYRKAGGPELSFVGILQLVRHCFAWIGLRFRRLCHPNQAIAPSADKPMELTERGRTDTAGRSVSWDSRSHGRRDRDNVHLTDPNDDPLSNWHSFTESDESIHQKQSEIGQSARLTTLAALVHEHYDVEGQSPPSGSRATTRTRVKIIDPTQVLNDRLGKLTWPSEEWRTQCLTQSLCSPSVYDGLEGQCVHRWTPSNPDPTARSFCHRTIALVAFPNGPPLLDGHYVAIWEDKGLVEVSPDGDASVLGQTAETL
ncbi:Pecanex-like protein 1 [Clonorchis sinensis]|uniref:Pecanex-like protein n=1 Tax=Clonorchis sinensis TaxID=79923 RepID=A0A8T1MNJ4_CLOSI|nr:Pecanex-like protein 1 [Clonorchis sinensis]